MLEMLLRDLDLIMAKTPDNGIQVCTYVCMYACVCVYNIWTDLCMYVV